MDNLGRQLGLAYDGRITFDAMARATRRDFERMADYLLRRWAAPAWYVADDVVQELLLGAWSTMWDWSAAMSATLKSFVVFNAIGRAKRELHRVRGASLSGSPDRNPSRFEHPLSSYGEDGEAMAEDILAVAADAEAFMIEREDADASVRAAVEACHNEVERAVVRAIAEAGGVTEGIDAVCKGEHVRIRFQIGSEGQIESFIVRKARASRRECRAAS